MSWDPSHNMLAERPKQPVPEEATTAPTEAAPRRKMTDEEKQADKMFRKATRNRLKLVKEASGFKVKNFIVHARRYGVDRDEAIKLVEKKLSEKERKEQCLI